MEGAVIGVPDEQRGEIVKAFVISDKQQTGDKLRGELQEFIRNRLAKHAFPRQIEFIDELPKTASGKIRRIELREEN